MTILASPASSARRATRLAADVSAADRLILLALFHHVDLDGLARVTTRTHAFG
ncbi:hypothetical protein [Streptomyces noursei]|uniref:hypothetical protein n=1 Tax=Streptomyces noursei TaxID=1971 RepID=UPI000A8EAAAA|nr:hypothetical protein [Streptomyces noursei]